MTNRRPERIGDRVRDVLAQLIREEVRDPRVGFVTITGVDLSPDLKQARVYVSVMEDPESCVAALNRASRFLRKGLAGRAGLRYTPKLQFLTDESVAGGFQIERILREVGLGEDPAPTLPGGEEDA